MDAAFLKENGFGVDIKVIDSFVTGYSTTLNSDTTNSNNIGLIKEKAGYILTDKHDESPNKLSYHGNIGDNALDLSIQDVKIPPLPWQIETSSTTPEEVAAMEAQATKYPAGATGDYSTAMGNQTRSSGEASNAMGFGTYALGDTSTAMGNNTYARGDTSTAMGYKTTAHGNGSTSMGYLSTASGDYSTAMGYGTKAYKELSTAMGQSTIASGGVSTAMGVFTKASGYASTTMGEGTEASGDGSTAIGKFNIVDPNSLFVIGNGNNDGANNTTTYNDAFKVSYNGDTTISGKLHIKDIPDNGSKKGDIYQEGGILKIVT